MLSHRSADIFCHITNISVQETNAIKKISMIKRIVIKIIIYYQNNTSPYVRASCLYTPTCSEYMILAVEKYGTIRGLALGLKRIVKCRSPNGGIDYP